MCEVTKKLNMIFCWTQQHKITYEEYPNNDQYLGCFPVQDTDKYWILNTNVTQMMYLIFLQEQCRLE